MIARKDVVAGKILDRNHGIPRLQDAEFKAKVKSAFLEVFYDNYANYVTFPARGNDASAVREAINPTDFSPGIWLVLKGTTILGQQV